MLAVPLPFEGEGCGFEIQSISLLTMRLALLLLKPAGSRQLALPFLLSSEARWFFRCRRFPFSLARW